jgi:hypothetical protein
MLDPASRSSVQMLDPASRSSGTIRRPAKFVAVLSAAVVLVAGCGSGPSKTNAAAIIDGRTISVDDVQSRVEKVLRDSKFAQTLQQQHKLDLLSRSIVSREVSYELTAKAAEREQLTVDESALTERIAQRGSAQQELPGEAVEANLERAADSAFDSRDVARNELLAEALARKVLRTLTVAVDGGIVTSIDAKRDSQRLAKQIADSPTKAKDIIGKAGQDVVQPLQFTDLSLAQAVQIATRQGVDLGSSPLFGTTANTVVAFPLAPYVLDPQANIGNQWILALVKKNSQNAVVPPELQQALASVPQELLLRIGKRLAGQHIGDINIEISPRYGVWDPVGNMVAPRTEESVGYQYAALAAKP